MLKYIVFIYVLFFSVSVQADDCAFIHAGKCLSCDAPQSIVVASEKACIQVCPNRIINLKGSGSGVTVFNCSLPECPKDFPLRDMLGSCFSCNDTAAVAVENCLVCPNRYVSEYGRCLVLNKKAEISSEEIAYTSSQKVEDGACPKEYPLKNNKGYCFKCEESKVVVLKGKESLNKCPNRQEIADEINAYLGIDDYFYSVLKCPKDKPILDKNLNCYSTDEIKRLEINGI